MNNEKTIKQTKEYSRRLKTIDTLVISDLHLGDVSTRCREVLEVLNNYIFKRLILNGDILDGLEFKRLHSEDWDVLSKLRKLSKHCEVVWIHGNHDAEVNILSRLLGVTVYNKYIWKVDDKKFLAIHGQQFDRFLNNNIVISYLAFSFYHLLKKFNPDGYFIKLMRRNQTWKRNSVEVANGAIRFGWLNKADFVFCGHTHIINEVEKNGIRYFNTGSWTEKPSGYVTISGTTATLNQID